jgi:hypothetical protein
MDWMIKQFKKKTGSDATKDKRALQKLRREVIRLTAPKTCHMMDDFQRLFRGLMQVDDE